MTALWVTIAIVLDGAVALVGGVLPERWLQRQRPLALGFAAGALVAAAAFDLMPEAYETRGLGAVGWLAGSIAVLALAERLVEHHHEHADMTAFALLGSDALHNFGDGIAIAAAFLASPRLGAITAVAVIVHETPEELADYAILRARGMTKRRALVALALIQLTAGIGAAATLLGAGVGDYNGIMLAIAAGTFLYIAVAELVPEIARAGKLRAALAVVVGAAVIALVS
ncbi:MAG: ZIP family metal transporter [Acidobacteriota bacterium]